VPLGHLLINNAAIGATMVGTAPLASRAVATAAGRPVLMHDWWCAVLAAHGGALLTLPRPTIRWRRHSETVTGDTPDTLGGRGRRRRDYARWSINSAQWILGAEVEPVDDDADRSVRALASIDPERLPLSSFLRVWMTRGIRAWPLRRQIGLLSAVGMGRSNQ
jgi:hypothetical protein